MAKKQSNIEKFLALSNAQKKAEVDRAVHAQSRSLTVQEKREWKKVQAGLRASHEAKKMGRPVTGQGVKVISLSVEQSLLKKADAKAKKDGISRAALFAMGLKAVLT